MSPGNRTLTARKARKLLRDPMKFLADSSVPELKKLGEVLGGRSSPSVPPASSTSPVRAPSNVRAKTSSQLVATLRAASVLSGSHGVDSWWRSYLPFVRSDADVVVVPSGQPLWDRMLLKQQENLGYKVGFLPIWEFQGWEDPDTQAFALRKTITDLPGILRQVTLLLALGTAERLLLSIDSTPLHRGVSIAARQLGMTIILAANPEVLSSEGQDKPDEFSRPIADDILFIDYQKDEGDYIFPGRRVPSDRLRSAIGCQRNNELLLLLAPPLQLNRSDSFMRERLKSIWDVVRRTINEKTHLVIVTKRKKGGYLSHELQDDLKSIYSKTVVTYDEGASLEALVFSADRIAVVDVAEKLAVQCLLGDSVQSYTKPRLLSDSPNRTPSHAPLSSRKGAETLAPQLKMVDAIHSGEAFDVVAVPDPISNSEITSGRQRYLPHLLGFQKRVYGAGSIDEVAMAEMYIQWGAEPSESKSRPEIARCAFGRPKIYVEDGFVRSLGLWTDPNEPSFSLMFDTDGAYYDATVPNLVEKVLNSEITFTPDELSRARSQIDTIVRERISKYNYAPILSIPRTEKKRILLVDQKAGDMSIKYGCASSDSYFQMIRDADALGDDVDVLIKQHPCAITNGEQEAHFTAQSLGEFSRKPNVELVAFDINPFSLFEAVDEVWVVTSGMGFEALLAGKPVRTYGSPFYGGWGLTEDMLTYPRRSRQREIEEVFFLFYNCLTRYVDPRTGQACNLEMLLDYILQHRPAVQH